jgi:hypothetical protein
MDDKKIALVISIIDSDISLLEMLGNLKKTFSNSDIFFLGLIFHHIINDYISSQLRKIASLYLLYAIYNNVPLEKHPFASVFSSLLIDDSDYRSIVVFLRELLRNNEDVC